MRTFLYGLLGVSIALIGCDRQDGAVVREKAPKPAAAKAAACAPPPNLVLSPDFIDPSKKFGFQELASTKSNFASAYRKSCQDGLLRDEALMDAKASQPNHLFLHNAPEANIVSIYPRDESESEAPRRMVLEWYFVNDQGPHVPSIEDLEEAIFCHVKGATPKEEEETGRCLPD